MCIKNSTIILTQNNNNNNNKPKKVEKKKGTCIRTQLADLFSSPSFMAMAITLAARPTSLFVALARQRANRVVFNSSASSSAQPLSWSSSSSSASRKLILYSKPGCCLCDGLKEKLHAAFSLSAPEPLHDVDLQVPSSSFSYSCIACISIRIKQSFVSSDEAYEHIFLSSVVNYLNIIFFRSGI